MDIHTHDQAAKMEAQAHRDRKAWVAPTLVSVSIDSLTLGSPDPGNDGLGESA